MEIKHGLISSDSHVQLGRYNWLERMPKKFGESIPQVRETDDPKHMAVDWGEGSVERWFINGEVVGNRGVMNCPTAMQDPKWGEAGARRKYFPQRWSDAPVTVYNPVERLKALDQDGVDAEVLFPNDPIQGASFFQSDAAFELACVKAYNDGVAEWREVSDRYIPLAILPYLSGIETTVNEAKRAINSGHKGIVMLAEPRQTNNTLRHFNDPYWDPLWAACQDMGVAIHWHAGGGIRLFMPPWKGYTRNESQAQAANVMFAQAQFLPNVIFSGVLDRFPRLKWVCAETGLGWVNYILEGCDHEWERRHLWTEGLLIKPSDLFHRQMYVDFWYEEVGIQLRHQIGMENIMWESDFPHSTSTWPESWEFIERTLAGVPQSERNQLQFGNALKLYYNT